MTETLPSLQRKIHSANDLQAVVRTMKAMAASSIGQYENAVHALDDYYRTVQLGLTVCLRQVGHGADADADKQHDRDDSRDSDPAARPAPPITAIVFGSDQGLVGQFNDLMAQFASDTLQTLPGRKTVWAVGERIVAPLAESGQPADTSFALPNAISAITTLIGQILLALEQHSAQSDNARVYLFHNRPTAGAIYTPQCQRLLPLDAAWRRELKAIHWPSNNLPQVIDDNAATLLALVREYLFVSLFRTCAQSLASENASRLAAMQRAEKNIDDLRQGLSHDWQNLRQSGIDAELFDVVAGFDALQTAQP
jgi:F-type H+-transporting ATPase subunit gamma